MLHVFDVTSRIDAAFTTFCVSKATMTTTDGTNNDGDDKAQIQPTRGGQGRDTKVTTPQPGYLLRCFSSSQKSSFSAIELRPGAPPPPPPLASSSTFSLIEACTHSDRDTPRKQADTTTTTAASFSSVRLTLAL